MATLGVYLQIIYHLCLITHIKSHINTILTKNHIQRITWEKAVILILPLPLVACSASVGAWPSIADIMPVHRPKSPLVPSCLQLCILLTSSRKMRTQGHHNRSFYKFHQNPIWWSIEFIGLTANGCGLTDRSIDNSKATVSFKNPLQYWGWLTKAASLGFPV